MRTSILMLAGIVVIAACSDDQHPSAPLSSPPRNGVAAGDVAPRRQGLVTPLAKPVDQVGFSSVTSVQGSSIWIAVGDGPVKVTATCPAGTTAIGGGYTVGNWMASQYLIITNIGLNDANGWTVTGWVVAAGAPAVEVTSYATCIQ